MEGPLTASELSRISHIMIWIGLVGLGITVTLHLRLGLPPIDAAVSAGLWQDAPGMTVAELKAIWIAFSIIFYCLLTGLAFALAMSAPTPRLFTGTVGFAACMSALCMGWIVDFSHIALPLLLIPGLLLIGGAVMAPTAK